MHELVEYIGPNKSAWYFAQWKVRNHRICLFRGILGGIFIYVLDGIDKKVVSWPSYRHKGLMLCQINYLADQILEGNIKFVDSILPKMAFSTLIDEDVDPGGVVRELEKWQNEVFGNKLDPWMYRLQEGMQKFMPIEDFDVEEITKNYQELIPLAIADLDRKLIKRTKEKDVPKWDDISEKEEITDDELEEMLGKDYNEDDF